MTKETVNFDPNLNLCGNFANKTVELVFGTWRYRKTLTTTVGGNCSGLNNIQTAVGSVYANLSTDAWGVPCIVLEDSDGDTLECSDDENRDEEWLGDMLISATIIDIQPEKRD